MSDTRPMHLGKSIHDVTLDIIDIWCENSGGWTDNATEDIDRATCVECLKQAAEYGAECFRRHADIVYAMKYGVTI
jgi:hypothetical protein